MCNIRLSAEWIAASEDIKDVCPVFQKKWHLEKPLERAELLLTARGVYEARLNGKRVGKFVLAPGWTAYEKRLQVQRYDVTALLKQDNELTVTVGKGWFSSPMPGWEESADKLRRKTRSTGLIGELHLEYADGSRDTICTDGSWQWGESPVRFSEIYDGETFDASFTTREWHSVVLPGWEKNCLIGQEGEEICEMERICARNVFRTPSGETVVDFGQEVTGYVEFTVNAQKGDRVRLYHGEVLDQDGNFYNDNYRSARAQLLYICKDGEQTWHPRLTFFGFRYIKLAEFPQEAVPEQFTAVAVYSHIRRTGYIQTSSEKLNRLISNIFWSQKDNFLDVPTDCPQRDERLGWTGDAQVFVRAASYNFDVENFFRKWLRDLAADQRQDGSVGQVIPDYMPDGAPSAAWGDAAVICPWQIYLTYGNTEVLQEQFDSMKKWVDYITSATDTPGLWTGGVHFGDWLGLDAPAGSYKGSSRETFIATAFYAHSAQLLVKAGHILKKDMTFYEKLQTNIVAAFQETFPTYLTQTEHVLAVEFGLSEDPRKTVDALAEMITADGCRMRTGFVGTPYLLHVLSDYGYSDLAYTLLLREEYPSWLYSVNKGATTIWEHWDGIMEDGSFWSRDMNSFNHYAYGSVADWLYEKAAGIQIIEEYPGFEKVRIAPHPDRRLSWLEASIDTRHGRISSRWGCEEDSVRYEILTEVPAQVVIGGVVRELGPGQYTFYL